MPPSEHLASSARSRFRTGLAPLLHNPAFSYLVAQSYGLHETFTYLHQPDQQLRRLPGTDLGDPCVNEQPIIRPFQQIDHLWHLLR